MSQYSIEVKHPSFKFNSAHFIAISNGCKYRERLHGHNYRVSVRVFGSSELQNGYVMDFKEIKDAVRILCAELDERFLCPMLSNALQIQVTEGKSLNLICEDSSCFLFPLGDTVCLPIQHTSSEELSQYLWNGIVRYGLCNIVYT